MRSTERKIWLCIVLLCIWVGIAIARTGDVSIERVLNDIWSDSDNAMTIRLRPGLTSIITNQLTIDAGTAGTPVVLTPDTLTTISIHIRALPSNTANIYIGASATGASNGQGFVLTPSSDTLVIVTDSTDDIYMNAALEGEGISWLAVR